MAYSIVNYQWIFCWCFLFYVVIVELTIIIEPSPVYVEYGTPLRVLCYNTEGKAKDLEFSVGGKTKRSKISNDTIILYEKNPEKSVYTLYCSTTAKKYKNTTRIIIDSKPKNVKNISCISNNFETLTCSWSKYDSPSEIKYELQFYERNNRSLEKCTPDKTMTTPSCEWNLSNLTNYRHLLDMKQITFLLNSSNAIGVNLQKESLDHYAIVKPAAIKEIVVDRGVHEVSLSWNISNNILDYLKCGVDFEIKYEMLETAQSSLPIALNTEHLPSLSPNYNISIYLPYAFMKYNVTIRLKSKHSSSLWSDIKYSIVETKSEIPQRPPYVPTGSFYVNYNNNNLHRKVYIYWQPLENYEKCGSSFAYTLSYSYDKSSTDLNYLEANDHALYTELLSPRNKDLFVKISSKNIEGHSINTSHIYVPANDHILQGVMSFTKLIYKNGTHELSWLVENKVFDNYTLFWCKNYQINVCNDHIYSTTLDSTKTFYIIDLDKNTRYQFGLSINKGQYSSGISWASCEMFSKDVKYTKGLMYLDRNKDNIIVNWDLMCTLRYYTAYKISYCPENILTNKCDMKYPIEDIINDTSIRHYVIKNVFKDKKYKIELSIEVNNENYTLYTNASIGPLVTSDYSVFGLRILVAVLVSLSCLIITYKINNVQRKRRDIKVIIPEGLLKSMMNDYRDTEICNDKKTNHQYEPIKINESNEHYTEIILRNDTTLDKANEITTNNDIRNNDIDNKKSSKCALLKKLPNRGYVPHRQFKPTHNENTQLQDIAEICNSIQDDKLEENISTTTVSNDRKVKIKYGYVPHNQLTNTNGSEDTNPSNQYDKSASPNRNIISLKSFLPPKIDNHNDLNVILKPEFCEISEISANKKGSYVSHKEMEKLKIKNAVNSNTSEPEYSRFSWNMDIGSMPSFLRTDLKET